MSSKRKKTIIPRGYAAFAEFIVPAYQKAVATTLVYGISPEMIAAITPSYDAFIAAEAVATNPETATSAARKHRDHCRKTLESDWRNFLNECIRFNKLVGDVDLAVFGIIEVDSNPSTVGIPVATPSIVVNRLGAFSFEVRVLDSKTGKPKKPENANGSYLYVAVTEIGQQPAHVDDYRERDFSSDNKHVLEFMNEQVGKQAHVFARYSNAYGKEGPRGENAVIVIY
ncbi:MAG: hypothetical protein LBT50_01635 [Prevotellaceae bacterium]|jgi:hypothetical protein|nr:hypothetical protein [Prevotellaceae bacterium]